MKKQLLITAFLLMTVTWLHAQENIHAQAMRTAFVETLYGKFPKNIEAKLKRMNEDSLTVAIGEWGCLDGGGLVPKEKIHTVILKQTKSNVTASAEICLTKEGKVVVMPHEYGTYTFKNGVYSEMGRPAVKPDEMVLVDKTTFKGKWKNRHDVWKKKVLPDKVVKYIVNCCKFREAPADIQQLIKQNMFM